VNAKPVFSILAVILAFVVSTGCDDRPNTRVKTNPNEKVIYNSYDARHPENRPDWTLIDRPAEHGAFFYFTGVSDRFTTELDARDHALFMARKEIADRVLNLVETSRKESRDRAGSAGDGSDIQVGSKSRVDAIARVAVSQVQPKEWFLRKIQAESGKVYWEAMVLAEIPRDAIQREINRVSRALNALEKDDKTFPLKSTRLTAGKLDEVE